jgi:multidrug efflux system outer membrane protein
MTQRFTKSALALALAALLAGCTVGPDYARPDVPVPTNFPELLPPESLTVNGETIAVDWWTVFGDPLLDDLVQRALGGNEDIRQAIARIEETDATLRAVNSAFLPEVDVTAGAARAAIPRSQAISGVTVSNAWRLGLTSTFEVDFWGKFRRASESARASTTSSRYAAGVVRITTIGVTAQTYFALRSLDAQIATTEATLGSRGEALRLTQRRAQAGLVSDLDVNQAELARADAAAQLKDLVRQRAIAQHALGVLTGNLDLAIAPADLMRMPVPAMPPAGLPSTLLVRRPDIQQAEQDLIAQNARVGLVRADMFPTISLTAGFGTLSTALTQFVTNDNRTWNIGASLLAPIFDAGRRRALTEVEEAKTREQIANYRRTVERSFREVADALVTVRQTAASDEDQVARVRAATNALRLANLRYDAGYSAFLEVLDAQRSANDAQLSLIRNRQALLSADVDLMRALGGGWTPEQPVIPVAVQDTSAPPAQGPVTR